MMKRTLFAVAALGLAALPALAQERPAPPPPGFAAGQGMSAEAALRAGFALGFSAGQEVHAELARLRARNAELERLCGEACKGKAPEAAAPK